MTSLASRPAALLTLLVAAGLLLQAACGGNGGSPAASTQTPAAPATSAPAGPTPTASTNVTLTTPTYFNEIPFAREPVEEPGDTSQPAPWLIDVETGTFDEYDRVLLQFDGSIPGYRVEYVSSPITACGSGLPVEIAGDAFLQIRMSPAAAHDDEGTATFDQTELAPNLPAVLEVEQTCDFEGVLIWVIGLSQETDFRVFNLTAGLLVVDVQHP